MTIDRRTLLAGALAIPFLGGVSHARDFAERDARAEFLKILAMFNSGDVAGFIAYGPPKLMVEKTAIDSDGLPAFFESSHNFGGKADEKPGWIDGKLLRAKSDRGRVIYGAVVRRSVWQEARCEPTDPIETCYDAGYGPRFEQWHIYFRDNRIIALHQWMSMQ